MAKFTGTFKKVILDSLRPGDEVGIIICSVQNSRSDNVPYIYNRGRHSVGGPRSWQKYHSSFDEALETLDQAYADYLDRWVKRHNREPKGEIILGFDRPGRGGVMTHMSLSFPIGEED